MTERQAIAEILVIGNELLNGTTLDTNSFWISRLLTRIGVRVERKTTIRDNVDTISKSFKQVLLRKPDWIFSIGGLGPTYDDMTLRGLSVAVGSRLKLDRFALEMLKESYRRRGRTYRRLSEARLKMVMIPEGATPLPNLVGSAPGVLIKSGNSRIVSLPGVPSEMKSIFKFELLPILESGTQFTVSEEWLEIIGLPESSLAPIISKLSENGNGTLYIKSHPRGSQRGRPVLHLQIILSTQKTHLEEGKHFLKQITNKIVRRSRRLGASVTRTRSIR